MIFRISIPLISKIYTMIVVTGGTGLLGGHLLLELIRKDQPVRALIRKGGNPQKVLSIWKHYEANPESLLSKVEWVPIDLTNKPEISGILKDTDELYHCAGKISFNPRDKKELYSINVEATSNIVNACLESGNIRLLHVSSIAAIGKSDQDLCTEDNGWPSKSGSLYSRTKTLGEFEVWRGISEGLDAIIVNPSVILAPGNWKESSARIFNSIYKGLNYYTLGETGFVDVLDVVKIMTSLMNTELSGERFILNAENVSYKSLFERIALALHVTPPKFYASQRKTSLAWRIEALKQFFTGIEPRLTKHSSKTAHSLQRYSSMKIKQLNDFQFSPMDATIRRIAKSYLADIRNKQV